jgi:anti-anti-sigma factor
MDCVMQPVKIRYSDCFEVEQAGGTALIRFEDPAVLHNHNTCRLADDLYGLVDQHDMVNLVLDMSGVRFMSSDVLGTLVNLHRKARAAGGKLVLARVSDRIARMFHVTRLDTILTLQVQTQETEFAAGAPGGCQTQAVHC